MNKPPKMQKKNFSTPDDTTPFPNGEVRVITCCGTTFGHAVLKPGWRWSKDVKPIAKTASCQAPHTQYIMSGRIMIRMDDGEQMEAGPGDVIYVPPGHDAWVLGKDNVTAIDVTGLKDFAKQK